MEDKPELKDTIIKVLISEVTDLTKNSSRRPAVKTSLRRKSTLKGPKFRWCSPKTGHRRRGVRRSEAPLPSHTCTWSSGTCSWSSGCRGGCWQRPGWRPGSDASSDMQSQRNSRWLPGTQAHGSTCSVEGEGRSLREAQTNSSQVGPEHQGRLTSAGGRGPGHRPDCSPVRSRDPRPPWSQLQQRDWPR